MDKTEWLLLASGVMAARHTTRAATRALRRALPRRRALCTNSKKPRYSGSFSCEMPRCGRSQERSKDHVPSIVLTWISRVDVDLAETVAILIARVLSATVTDRLVPIAPGRQTCVDVVLVGVDAGALGHGGLDDRLDRLLLHVGQHAQHHLSAALHQAEDRRFVLRQRAAPRRSRQPAAASEPPPLATAAGWPLCPATM